MNDELRESPESPESLFDLGKRFYLPSSGVADPLLALYYFQRSAEGGYVPAQRVLGTCYLDGTLTAPDYDKALHWLTLAARHNDGQATLNLAKMYLKGLGAPRNWRVALKLLNMKSASGLDEVRALKEGMKGELVRAFPEITKRLAALEAGRRAEYTIHRQRFIQPWDTPGRPQMQNEELDIWIRLNFEGLHPTEAMTELAELMAAYYDEQEQRHSPTGR
ncbi:sel1 repeat family protein [Deltaproteobacteria bacterium OttesenSCG-928-K17]|nr:sel1 repeat family protein [Deltaproteobacteria bacterium OttesenSCG-928-K17]